MAKLPNWDNSDFPNLPDFKNKHQNEFDYSQWQGGAACVLYYVPWDGIANQTGFETADERRAYFATLDGMTTSAGTPIKLNISNRLKPVDTIVIPVPFDVAACFNYVTLAFDAMPVAYEQGHNTRREWFYFIDSAEADSPSTTTLHIKLDTWTTYAPDVRITGLMLERGHYAIANSASVDTYLVRPLDNTSLLLAHDVDYSAGERVANQETFVFNDTDIYFCMMTRAYLGGDFGTADTDGWNTPSGTWTATQGVPAARVYGLHAENAEAFIKKCIADMPNFVQTIEACFFVSEKLITLTSEYSFQGFTLSKIGAVQQTFDFLKLDKNKFGYDSRYSDLTKLYTSPYAYIEVSDGAGKTTQIKIEDTTGTIKLNSSVSLMLGALNYETLLTGISADSSSVTFANINSSSIKIGGRWYDLRFTQAIPTFAVQLGARKDYEASSYYDRQQSTTALTNTYDSTIASASTSQTNANNTASTAQNVTAIQVAANNSINSTSSAASSSDTLYTNELNTALQAWNAGYSRATVAIEVEGQQESAGVSIGGTVVGTAAGVVNSALSGDIGGAIGSIINGVTSGVTTAANTAISVNMATSKVEAAISNTANTTSATNSNNTSRNQIKNNANTSNVSTQNSANTAMTSANASNTRTNASNTYNTAAANASRSRSTSRSAITNALKTAGVKKPVAYGVQAAGSGAVMPTALYASIVTQSSDAIRRAGDQFLRYGYACNEWVEPTTLNVMPSFSYWRASDIIFTIDNGASNECYNDIKQIFTNGATFWRNPNNIRSASIYDNR